MIHYFSIYRNVNKDVAHFYFGILNWKKTEKAVIFEKDIVKI